jgi:hypothetical protein
MNPRFITDEIGSPNWWRGPAFASQGPVETILRLLEQKTISRSRALNLLQYVFAGGAQDHSRVIPSAPWDELNWCGD